MVSWSIQNLFRTHERSCWIETLSKTRETRPIPCPPDEDITTTKYDAKTLRGLVQHFNRLNRNWESDKPQIIGPVKRFTIDQELDTLAQIPGTKYVITHSIPESRASVWSIEDGQQVCSVGCHRRVLDLSTGWSEHGKFTIALLTNSDGDVPPDSIQVLTVDYSGPTVTIDISLSWQLESVSDRYFRAIFLNAEVVGVLYIYSPWQHTPSPVHVLACNRITNRQTDICVHQSLSPDDVRIIWRYGQVGTSFWKGNLYIHTENAFTTWQLWVPRHQFPYDDVIDVAVQTDYNTILIPSVRHPLGMGYKDPVAHVQLEGVLTTHSAFGVIALTIYNVLDYEASTVTLINYWIVDAASQSVLIDETIRLPVPTLYPCVIIPGPISASVHSAWYLCQSTNYGTYLILMTDELDGTKIRLVHLKLPNYHFTVHTLEPPSFVKPHLVSGFFVDEYRGTVALYQAEGEIVVCEFA